MLEISPSAVALIRKMITSLPGIGGIRLTVGPLCRQDEGPPSASVILAPTAAPSDGEETVVCGDLKLFLTPAGARLVDDKVLEVAAGGGGRLRFILTPRAEWESPPATG